LSALTGRRVLELADEKGAYCGKLLADMGADVIKIEPPGGDATRTIPPFWGNTPHPDRSLLFLYMNTSKRGVTLDLTQPEGRSRFTQLAGTAHLIIETFPPGYLDELGLGYAALKQANPGLVLTSITGFGQTGPAQHFKSSDLVISALGGALYVTGEETDPPVTLAGLQAYMMASLYAAASSMIALYHSSLTGVGQHVDISAVETMVSATHICGVGKWLDDHIIPRRMGTGLFASVPSGAYPCRDGLVYLTVNRPAHWRAFAEWIHEVTGNEAILDPLFEGPSSNRFPHRDLLDLYISDLTARFTVDTIYREGQRRHVAITPVNTAAAVTGDPHLAARRYFVEVEHQGGGVLRYPGAPFRPRETPWRISRPAPRVGEHNEEILSPPTAPEANAPDAPASAALPPLRSGTGRTPGVTGGGALENLRVVEFTAGMAGPWIGRFMAHCGAEVIKVESKKRPDVTRQYIPPWAPELGIQPQLSPWFTDWNGGKRFVALDLTHPRAVELCKRIVAISDVVVENYSTGVMEKLGLGYPALQQVKPDLIMCSSSGYGDTGPNRNHVTWGPNIEAISGLSTVSGFPERPCTITQYAYPDTVSALHGLFAVMCALHHRHRTGKGQYINLSQYEATAAVIGHVLMEYLVNGREPRRLGNRSLFAAPHGCYRCAGDDRWCAITVSSDAEWRRFCRVIGKPGWVGDPRFSTRAARLENADQLDRAIEDWTSSRCDYDVMAALQDAGVAAGVVQNVEDQFHRDRQLAARHFFEEIEHVKKGKVVATGIPLGLTGTPGRTRGTGAAIGQDNDYIFGDLLGLSPEEIRQFVEAGAIERRGD